MKERVVVVPFGTALPSCASFKRQQLQDLYERMTNDGGECPRMILQDTIRMIILVFHKVALF